MKLKAIVLALAFVVSIGTANAKELILSKRSVHVAQTDTSRLYRAEWIAGYSQTPETELSQVATSSLDEPDAAPSEEAEAAASQLSDTLKAKVRAIVAFARQEAQQQTEDGSRVLRSRIRVRCSAKQVVVAQRKASLNATPALLLSQRAASEEPTAVKSTLEVCTVKLLQLRSNALPDGGTREFEITLPPLEETAP
jgi:hypothetical protein